MFSIFIICALGFMGNMVQSNSIGAAFNSAFGVNKLAVGVVVALVAAIIFLGGVKRIASVTEKIVPVMALFYVLGSVILIIGNIGNLGHALSQIFIGAFNPQAVAGGLIGLSVQKAIRFGVARGLFSNEAGMGSTPHAHALAKVKHPCDQGLVAMMGVFIDTFVVLTMTALTILVTGVYDNGLEGAELAQSAFESFYGSWGAVFIAISLLFFAFSTIIGWYFFGEQNVKYLFGKKAVSVYALLVVLFVVVGSTLKVDLVWDLSDMFNGLMVIPNLLGLLALSGTVCRMDRAYHQKPEIEEEPILAQKE